MGPSIVHFPPNGNKLPPHVSSYIITKFSLAGWHNVWCDVHTLNISDKSSGSAQLELLRLSPWFCPFELRVVRSDPVSGDRTERTSSSFRANILRDTLELVGLSLLVNKHKFVSSA